MPAPVMQNHLPRTEDLMLQNATPLTNSAPRPPNISDEHVSCTAPATENVSLQILFKCPTPANPVETASKPARFVYFWQSAQSERPKVVHTWGDLCISEMCFAPTRRALFRHVNFQKCSKNGVSCTHFGLEMCFVPQQPALFRLQKCCEHEVFVHFDLKSAPSTRCVVHFELEISFAAQRRASLVSISHLASWLHTRRFSEPSFRPSGATNHWKNIVVCDFSTFSRAWIFFLLTLSLLWSSLFFSSLLWLFPPLLFHRSILSEVWLPNFLR